VLVETLGEAYSYGWRIDMRCLDDGREGLKHKRRCGFRGTLDMQTLVCTRGRDFPLARIAERLATSALRLPARWGDVHAFAECRSDFSKRQKLEFARVRIRVRRERQMQRGLWFAPFQRLCGPAPGHHFSQTTP
jgi:hypothetical protein